MGRGDEAGVEVHLVPVGPLSRPLGEELAARVSRRLRAACRLATGSAALATDLPRVPGRDQLDADALLVRLETLAIRDTEVVVGVTPLDIAVPIFTFVFGRARAGGRAALVSTARLAPDYYGLPPDPRLTVRRAAGEVLHELGHVAGLRHCDEATCLMRFAGSVDQVDVRGSVFCARCAALLPEGLL